MLKFFFKKPPISPQLFGIRNFYTSAPLRNTKYIETLVEDTMVYFPDSVMAELFGEKPHSLRECAENFLATEIYHLYRNDKESFKKIRECYIVASKDGIYEAINNLAVFYYWGKDFEHNTLKEDIQLAKKYLKRIIETAEIEILEDEEKKAFDAAKKLLSVLDKSD